MTDTLLARFESRMRFPSALKPGESATRPALILVAILSGTLVIWLLVHYLVGPEWLRSLPPLMGELIALFEWAAALTIGIVALFLYWRARKRLIESSYPLSAGDLYQLSPKAFEHYVACLFRKKGYLVRIRGRSGDRGVDLEIEQPGQRRAIVQCKRYRNPIGPDVVRELFGTMIHERVHHAFLVTTAEISPAARDWARDKPITLIDGSTLVAIAASLDTPLA